MYVVGLAGVDVSKAKIVDSRGPPGIDLFSVGQGLFAVSKSFKFTRLSSQIFYSFHLKIF